MSQSIQDKVSLEVYGIPYNNLTDYYRKQIAPVIEAEMAVYGFCSPVEVPKLYKCPPCNGTGIDIDVCRLCGGHGEVPFDIAEEWLRHNGDEGQEPIPVIDTTDMLDFSEIGMDRKGGMPVTPFKY